MRSARAGAKVHSGDWSFWTTLRSNVFASVEKAVQQCPACDTIALVGHSLGGAGVPWRRITH